MSFPSFITAHECSMMGRYCFHPLSGHTCLTPPDLVPTPCLAPCPFWSLPLAPPSDPTPGASSGLHPIWPLPPPPSGMLVSILACTCSMSPHMMPQSKNNIFHLAWKNSENGHEATLFPSIRYSRSHQLHEKLMV